MTAKEARVRKQLAVVIALTALASLTLLLTLIPRQFLPDKAGALLVMLLPIAFCLHVTEEFIFPGGFIGWDNGFRPQYAGTPGSFYVRVNAFPAIASLLIVLGAFDYAGKYSLPGIRAWLALLTFMTWNAGFHLRGAIRTKRYSPGIATGLVLFVPLAVISYLHFMRIGVIDIPSAVLCIAIAMAVQPVLDRIKSRGRKQA